MPNKGYPSVFYAGSKNKALYEGHHSVPHLEMFLKKNLMFPVRFTDNITEKVDPNDAYLVPLAVFYTRSETYIGLFSAVASSLENSEIHFVVIDSDDDKLRIYQSPFRYVEYSGLFVYNSVRDFVVRKSVLIVRAYSVEVEKELFDRNTPALLYVNHTFRDKVIVTLAPKISIPTIFFKYDPNDLILQYIGIKKVPTVLILYMNEQRWEIYKGTIEKRSLKIWINDIRKWSGPGDSILLAVYYKIRSYNSSKYFLISVIGVISFFIFMIKLCCCRSKKKESQKAD